MHKWIHCLCSSCARAPSGRKRGATATAKEARAEIHRRTLECPRCGHLLDWRTSKTQAYARTPPGLEVGDGCLGVRCGKRNATRAERAKAMRKYCTALEKGDRLLVAWPDDVHDTDVWARPPEAVERVLREMRDQYGA